MKLRLWHMGIALVLAMLTRHFSVAAVLLALMPAWLVQHWPDIWREKRWQKVRLGALAWFVWDFLVDLTKSNLRMALDVLTPKDLHRVRMVLIPIDDLTDFEVLLLSNRITLTPGTLTCAVTGDRRHLLVHTMYLAENETGIELRRPLDRLKGKG